MAESSSAGGPQAFSQLPAGTELRLKAAFRGLCMNCHATLDVMLYALPDNHIKCKVHVVRFPPRAKSRSRSPPAPPSPPALPGQEYPPTLSLESAPGPAQEYPPPASHESPPGQPSLPGTRPPSGDVIDITGDDSDWPLLGPDGLLEQAGPASPPPDIAPVAGAEGLPDGLSAPPPRMDSLLGAGSFLAPPPLEESHPLDSIPETQRF